MPELLNILTELSHIDSSNALATSDKLRKLGYQPELIAQALTQHRLRERATAKFGTDATHMLFTEAGLEQATRQEVAARRAARLKATGAHSVIDLGCGIGADLIAFTRAGLKTTGIELDPHTAELAATNLAALNLHGAVLTGDATTIDLDQYDAIYCDPARRGGGRRIFDPENFSPPWNTVTDLLQTSKHVCVKLGPGLEHSLIPPGVEAEWVSSNGTVVELALWSHSQKPGLRRAVVFGRHKEAVELIGSGTHKAPVGVPQTYLYDPDGAVVRSHLIAELSEELNAHLIDEHIAYLTSDKAVNTPFARRLTVEEVMPFSVKKLRSWLRTREIGTLEIKKRGIAITPEQLRPQLKLRGPNKATVVLTRLGTQPTAFICS